MRACRYCGKGERDSEYHLCVYVFLRMGLRACSCVLEYTESSSGSSFLMYTLMQRSKGDGEEESDTSGRGKRVEISWPLVNR